MVRQHVSWLNMKPGSTCRRRGYFFTLDIPLSSGVKYSIYRRYLVQNCMKLNLYCNCSRACNSEQVTLQNIWIWIWISCWRSNEPCAVIAGPLPPNVNTAQQDAMVWIKLKHICVCFFSFAYSSLHHWSKYTICHCPPPFHSIRNDKLDFFLLFFSPVL
jgi:hypothetical protein